MSALVDRLRQEWRDIVVGRGLGGLVRFLLRVEMWVVNHALLNTTLLNFEATSIRRFVESSARSLSPGSHVLDAGAGDRPYRSLLSHCDYESCDIAEVSRSGTRHDFACDLSREIPRDSDTFDAVFSTQVLEHVPNADAALREMRRVLKPGGRLFLTVPQGDPLHEQPHHYANFTSFGLQAACDRTDLETIAIEPRTGYFRALGYRSMHLWHSVANQPNAGLGTHLPLLVLYPLVQLMFGFLLPLAMLALDPLDRERKLTLGYSCHFRKPDARARAPIEPPDDGSES